MRLLRPLVIAPMLAAAQGVHAQAAPATLRGVVRDSIAHAPLAGAWVQLVDAGRQATRGRTVITDSLGRFAFEGLPTGRYLIGFFHSVLDSLGVEPPVRQVSVSRRRVGRIELATPSATRIRMAICGASEGGAVMGVVRDARTGRPLDSATVAGEWLELSFNRGGVITRQRGQRVANSARNGWFALCSVPRRGMMYLLASRGADSTDLIDVQVPASGFVRRDLYVGPSRIVDVVDSTGSGETPLLSRRQRVGSAQLQGTIVGHGADRPVAGAVVRLADNPPMRADERGAFTIADAPLGTRMLEVRAVGYSPARLAVDVIARDGPPVAVALTSSKALLDTVRVVVARAADRHNSGFEDRRRSGAGTYLTAQQIARRGVFSTSDLFRQLRGLRVGYDYDTLETDANPNALADMNQLSDRRILMRGISGNWCEPALWFDGTLIPELSVDALDAWLRPERLAALEVYSEATVPPQYQRARTGCGAVLFWTK